MRVKTPCINTIFMACATHPNGRKENGRKSMTPEFVSLQLMFMLLSSVRHLFSFRVTLKRSVTLDPVPLS